MKNKILKITAVICILACVLSVGQAVRIQLQYTQGKKAYDDLALNLVSLSADDNYESAEGGAPIDVDFELLRQMNAGAVGWLYCEGTPINYPVVQSTDNSYYLKHLYNNQNNSSGAIFMDALNNPDMTDMNTLIYGHNMKNGTMFACLQNYSDPAYLRQHPVMYYLTSGRDYKIEVFSCYTDGPATEAYTIAYDSPDTYAKCLQRSWSLSEVSANVPMTINDRIITLVTCTGYNSDRYVVQGKITPIN